MASFRNGRIGNWGKGMKSCLDILAGNDQEMQFNYWG